MLAPCPECDQDLSTTARSCPHCGYEPKGDELELETTSKNAWIYTIALSGLIKPPGQIPSVFRTIATSAEPRCSEKVLDWCEKYLWKELLGREKSAGGKGLRNSARETFNDNKAAVRKAIDFLFAGLHRVEQWHSYAVALFERGWAETGHPDAKEIAREFFGGDLYEATAVMQVTPAIIEKLYPKNSIHLELVVLLQMLAKLRDQPEQMDALFQCKPQLHRTILTALWNSPDMVQQRQEVLKRSSGCLVLICALIGAAIALGVKLGV